MYEDLSDEQHQDAYSTLVGGYQFLLKKDQGIFVENSLGKPKVIIRDDEGNLSMYDYNPDDFPYFELGTIINFT